MSSSRRSALTLLVMSTYSALGLEYACNIAGLVSRTSIDMLVAQQPFRDVERSFISTAETLVLEQELQFDPAVLGVTAPPLTIEQATACPGPGYIDYEDLNPNRTLDWFWCAWSSSRCMAQFVSRFNGTLGHWHFNATQFREAMTFVAPLVRL